MNLWLSAETQSDIFEAYRLASIKVEDCINMCISSKDYRIPLDSWDCIAVLRDDDSFKEVVVCSTKKRNMDFRLKVDYLSFKNGNDLDREALLYDMLMRSLSILEEKGFEGEGMKKLILDVKNVGKKQGWEA